MITVQVIFIGLIAFAPMPDGDDYMAVLVDAPGHQSVLFQDTGTCGPDPRLCHQLSGDETMIVPLRLDLGKRLGWSPLNGELVLLDHTGLPLDGELTFAGGEPSTDRPRDDYPTTDAEATHFVWVPSIDRMVTGPARIRGACMSKGNGCSSSARFHLQEGELSSCHMMHLENDPYPLVYDFGTHRQAVANAVKLTVEAPGPEVRVGVRGMDGGDVVHSVALRPPSGGDTVTLVVMNEPAMTSPVPSPAPRELSHFEHFYGLLQLFGRGKKHKPVFTGKGDTDVEFSCEDLFNRIYGTIFKVQRPGFTGPPPPPGFPHGPTECDAARIP